MAKKHASTHISIDTLVHFSGKWLTLPRWENGFIAGPWPQGRRGPSSTSRKTTIVKYSSMYLSVNYLSDTWFILTIAILYRGCKLRLTRPYNTPLKNTSTNCAQAKTVLDIYQLSFFCLCVLCLCNFCIGTTKDAQLREWLNHVEPTQMTWIFLRNISRLGLLCLVYLGMGLQPTHRLPTTLDWKNSIQFLLYICIQCLNKPPWHPGEVCWYQFTVPGKQFSEW